MRGLRDGDRFVGKIQLELVAHFVFIFAVGFRVNIGVDGARNQLR
jgi:hypothetical protein